MHLHLQISILWIKLNQIWINTCFIIDPRLKSHRWFTRRRFSMQILNFELRNLQIQVNLTSKVNYRSFIERIGLGTKDLARQVAIHKTEILLWAKKLPCTISLVTVTLFRIQTPNNMSLRMASFRKEEEH